MSRYWKNRSCARYVELGVEGGAGVYIASVKLALFREGLYLALTTLELAI